MLDHQEILTAVRMIEAGCSYEQIRLRLNSGSSDITRIKQIMTSQDITSSKLNSCTVTEVMDLFYPGRSKRDTKIPFPDYAAVHQKLLTGKPRTNLYMEWTLYRDAYPDGYGYSQYKHHYQCWKQQNQIGDRVKMVINRKPGEKLYIDWAGTVEPMVANPKNPDQPLKAHFFVTTLGYSSLLYVRALPDEKVASVAEGTVEALNYYGACPKYFVPDNMKTAVIKNTKDNLVLNQLMRDMEHYYDVIVLPAAPLKPTGKGSVENAVKYIETWIIRLLKGQIFHSFEELNERILELVNQLNHQTRRGEKKESRMEVFQKVDLPVMKKLPAEPFRWTEYAVCRVSDDYHIKFSGHYYSVPYHYYSKSNPISVFVKATRDFVLICDMNNQLIYRHSRCYGQVPEHITAREHMPAAHLMWSELENHTGDYYRNWATRIGPNMGELITQVLLHFEYEQQGYRSAQGILHACDHLSNAISEEAARRCIEKQDYGYRIFKYNLKEVREESETVQQSKPASRFLRGKEEFE